MSSISPRGACALAALLMLVLAAPAAAQDTDRRSESFGAVPVAVLAPLDIVDPPRDGAAPRRAAVADIARAAVGADRARRPAFPVRGRFNWGQEGAGYGASRSGRSHEGQDVFAITGTPLVSPVDGEVVETGNDGGRGNYVAVFDPVADRTYVMLHMNEPSRVQPGRPVLAGQPIGSVGCTGSCFGDHLHFESRRGRGSDGPAEDPRAKLLRWAQASQARATLAPGAS